MEILIASDGSACARDAALFACHIARPARAGVLLLGVIEKPQAEPALRRALGELRQEIIQSGVGHCEIKLRSGEPAEQILLEAHEQYYHLTVVGARGQRRLFGIVVGSTTLRLAQQIRSPLLIATQPSPAIYRMLVCTSGEKLAESNALVGGTIAALVGARVTVLHAMSQLPLTLEAKVEDLERDALELIASGTREGLHLQRMLEILDACGIPAEHRFPKVRHGLVVDEILAEVHEGDYDLVVIGAHRVPEGIPYRQLYTLFQENIANQILTQTRYPVLVVRGARGPQWERVLPRP